MATYRAAIIGAGGISARHINGWLNHPDVEIVAIADISEANAERRAEEFGIPNVYTDYQDMLTQEKPDLVSICTWMIGHAEQAVAASEAGVKGILCEKPFAGSLQEIDTVLDAARKNDTRIALGHHHRFSKINEEVRRRIAEGAIGTPTLCHRPSQGGVFNNSSHQVDTVRFILQDPAPLWALGQVSRTTDRYERHEPIEDLCGGIICLEGGTRIVLESDFPDPQIPETGTTFHGTEGSIIINTRSGYRLFNGETGSQESVELEPGEVGAAQARELVDWLEGRVESHRNNAQNNRTTIEALMGLYESARTRSLVTFPLPSGPSPLHQMIEDGTLKVTQPGKYDIRIKEQ